MKRTEHTQKWLDALRGGEYKQGDGALFRKDSYCCLGVGGAVAGIDLGINDNRNAAYKEIRECLGISITEQDILTEFNDFEELTFPEIAGKIEEMLEPDECQ